MAFFDLPLDELVKYKPLEKENNDFDDFWNETLSSSRQYPIKAEYKLLEELFETVDVYDVTYAGYEGQSIKGWFVRPKGTKKLPVIIEYIGYGGGRGLSHDWLTYASAGYAHFIMDTRGQGSGWSPGDTPDIENISANPQSPGFMTRGILDKSTYYYRRVFTDAVRAVDAVKERDDIDKEQITILGGSQGGGITLAVAGLEPSVKYACPDVPFLCHFSRSVRMFDSYPYKEIRDYLHVHRDKIDRVFNTLSYFDGINFAKRAKCKAFFSTALMDETCPPSTVYAAFNHYKGEKEIIYWEFNNHEGGGPFQKQYWLKKFKEILEK
ncbi:acetylxylan esterase [Spirochaeta cellobiosiphila]|uniref:acetylxylan esterase n=1 Tax=Spirochaeta cellobiosiphila TaxID=504483 RepID=UPI0003FFA83D|nr:alpha/beta fold hydrolase [Spirochaeta cellobiosiphila]